MLHRTYYIIYIYTVNPIDDLCDDENNRIEILNKRRYILDIIINAYQGINTQTK